MTDLIKRVATSTLERRMKAFRVALLNGPRQSGKSTVLRLFKNDHGGQLRSLDNPSDRNHALDDPLAFVRDSKRPLIIDEVQRAGDPLILAIKLAVDNDDSRGQFALAGSTNFLTVPTLSESLAGRIALVDMWNLSLSERTGDPGDFCDHLFRDPQSLLGGDRSPWSRRDYFELICAGGYPEVLRIPRDQSEERDEWFKGYLRTVIDRDIKDFAQLHRGDAIPDLVSLIAARAGSTLVTADLSRNLKLDAHTVAGYLSYLNMVYLIRNVRAWTTNINTKIARNPKSYLTDSGLLASRLGVTPDDLMRPEHPAVGGALETFVFTELTKLRSFSSRQFEVSHLRDRTGREVDFILERGPYDPIVAIEAKATSTPGPAHVKHLRWLRDQLNDRFGVGVLLHMGETSGSLGDRILALPVSALWGHRPLPN